MNIIGRRAAISLTLLTLISFSTLVLFGRFEAMAADSFSGKVTEVRSAEVITVDYGPGQYVVRIVGINAPKEGPLAAVARRFVAEKVMGKEIRARFQGRDSNGDMVSRIFVGDPGDDVGLEVVRAGLAERQQAPDPEYGYKYGELSKAENDAREAKRGLWAPNPAK
jgi:endonuclease YncB( thermonuclease family)